MEDKNNVSQSLCYKVDHGYLTPIPDWEYRGFPDDIKELLELGVFARYKGNLYTIMNKIEIRSDCF